MWFSKVCGRRGPHFCWVIPRQYAGGFRGRLSQRATWLIRQVRSGFTLELMEGLPVPAGPPQLSALVLARNGVGRFLLTLPSSCSTRFPPDRSCSSSSPFSSQWPHAPMCLGHALAYSFGPRKRNDSGLFTLSSDLFRHGVMWSP